MRKHFDSSNVKGFVTHSCYFPSKPVEVEFCAFDALCLKTPVHVYTICRSMDSIGSKELLVERNYRFERALFYCIKLLHQPNAKWSGTVLLREF